MTKKSFLHLLAKEISGGLSRDEQQILNESIENNALLGQVRTEIHRFVRAETQLSHTDVETKLNEVWNSIQSASESGFSAPTKRRRVVPLWARVAASAAIVLGLGYFAHRAVAPRNLYSEIITAQNENLYAVLDDGTQVWLGKNAQIDYNKNFGTKDRKICLTGEAFFDVAHNAAVPLTVSANAVDVTVKGTAFNVNASHDDVEVALVRGLVGVKDTRQKNAREILLHPNQKIVLGNGKAVVNERNYQITQANDTIVPETRWLNDALVFNKQRFADIAKLMETRYAVKINIQKTSLGEQRFTGSIKSENLPQMLDALKQSFPFEYEIDGETVVIK